MRRWIALLLSCLLSQHASSVLADSPRDVSLLARSHWAQFQIVLGRIEVANIHSSQSRTATSGSEPDELFEKLTISGDTDIPSVAYERVTEESVVVIAVVNGTRVEIDRLPNATNQVSPLSYRQHPGADVVLRIGDEAGAQVYRATTLWHLILAAPSICEEHLFPLLVYMQPSWQFEKTLDIATDELIREAASSEFQMRKAARRLVAKLKSADFTTRQQAQQQLGELGLGVLPYLNRLSSSELTREQQRRIDEICQTLRGSEADSPERIALWLVEDERAWISMLGHDELPIRAFAATHLTKRYTKGLDFDPSGTPLERRQQLAKIRTNVMLR